MEMAKTRRPARRESKHPTMEIADFLDVAGHELRAPLTALKGHAQILQRRFAKRTERDADEIELYKMLYQIDRLEQELDVYLEAARLFSGHFGLLTGEVDLVAIARKMVDLQHRGAAEDLLRLDCEPRELVGEWDRRRIVLALGALLSNAAKYGLGREAVLTLSRSANGARVEVEDRGIGIPPEQRRGIFGAYVTGGNVSNAGVGLGLYVAREIIRRHGGRIGVRARAGGGSVFWFELPIRVADSIDGQRAVDNGAARSTLRTTVAAHSADSG